MGRSLAMFLRWKNEFLTVFWTWGSKVRLMSNITPRFFNLFWKSKTVPSTVKANAPDLLIWFNGWRGTCWPCHYGSFPILTAGNRHWSFSQASTHLDEKSMNAIHYLFWSVFVFFDTRLCWYTVVLVWETLFDLFGPLLLWAFTYQSVYCQISFRPHMLLIANQHID